MRGKIIKAQKDLYYVISQDKTYMAKARGKFRKSKEKPLVGDYVEVDPQNENEAYITKIYPRINEIKRPNIANIDQILYFVTIKNPPLNLLNLDSYLAMCEHKKIDVTIILSKKDLAGEEDLANFEKIYAPLGYQVLALDNFKSYPKEEVEALLRGKTSALSGASGVGKSSFLRNLTGKDIEVGEISQKTKRGKNTTRHIEIFKVAEDSFLFDTPGFDSFELDQIEDERDLKFAFREMAQAQCRFSDCNHINEPDCRVKEKLERGEIADSRYQNYLSLFETIKKRRENKW